jgi:hypothetical protein
VALLEIFGPETSFSQDLGRWNSVNVCQSVPGGSPEVPLGARPDAVAAEGLGVYSAFMQVEWNIRGVLELCGWGIPRGSHQLWTRGRGCKGSRSLFMS